MVWDFEKFGDSVAVLDDAGNRITYKDLACLSDELGQLCGRALVFFFSENSIGSLAGYAAMVYAGMVPIMADAVMDHKMAARLLETYLPEYIWVPDRIRERFAQWKAVFHKYGFQLLRTGYSQQGQMYKELALLLTTSGSTGSPKLVRQSYENIISNTQSIVEYLGISALERPVTTLPMNYTYGLSIINTHLYTGAYILLTDKSMMQKEFWNFAKEQGATSFGGVPYHYEMLKKLRFFEMDLPDLRTMTQAGGKLSRGLHIEFAEYAQKSGKKFVVMYGQTEATARMAYLPADMALKKAGSIGIAVPGGRFELVGADGSVVTKEDTVGELVYYGANVTLGYAQCRKDLGGGNKREGVLKTGDMAKRDVDGFYYIVGRKNRFLKLFGRRVNLDEIEQILKEAYQTADCAATGEDDNLCIFVDEESIVDSVRHYAAEKMQVSLSAIKVLYIEKIPKNSSGKTWYAQLEKYCGTKQGGNL